MSMYLYDFDSVEREEIEEEFEFKRESVYVQLGRIVDSTSAKEIYNPKGKVRDFFRRFNAITSITTDDGVEFEFTPNEAKHLREKIMVVPSNRRLEFLKYIQNSEGFGRFVRAMA